MFNQCHLRNAAPVKKVYKKMQVVQPVDDHSCGLVDFDNPYKDISAESYSLKSQLANGVHLEDCGVRPLDSVHGADSVRAAADSVMNFKND